MKTFFYKLKIYLPLIKSLQTGLLLLTGVTGLLSSQMPITIFQLIGLTGSLFLAISGSTVLNMVYDRDIDASMNRTAHRPLPSGKISYKEALSFGLILSTIGLVWAFILSPVYSFIVFLGLFIDVGIYTIWLKRKSAWSIIWGGISGGMPILAGRVFGLGHIDLIGAIFALSILLWIPTHIMTFSMHYYNDYNQAGIPTFPSTYGFKNTRLVIALSSIGAALAIAIGIYAIGLSWGYLRLQGVMTIGIISLSVISIFRPSEKINFGIFKYASIYMLISMLCVIIGTTNY